MQGGKRGRAATDLAAVPFDLYPWDGTVDPARPLTAFQESLTAAALPNGGRLLDVRPHWHWDGRLTFPVYVRVSRASGEANEQTVLFRTLLHRSLALAQAGG